MTKVLWQSRDNHSKETKRRNDSMISTDIQQFFLWGKNTDQMFSFHDKRYASGHMMVNLTKDRGYRSNTRYCVMNIKLLYLTQTPYNKIQWPSVNMFDLF